VFKTLVKEIHNINYYLKFCYNNEPSAFFSRSWSQVYEVAKQPWFISIVFGVILLIATILTIRTILQDSKTKKKYDQRTASKKSISSYRTAKRSGAYQEPWFVAFLFAVGLIIILSFALFLLIVQKEGETFMGKNFIYDVT